MCVNGNSSNSYSGISLKATNASFLVVQKKRSKGHQVIEIHPVGNMNICAKSHGNPSIAIEIFQSGS